MLHKGACSSFLMVTLTLYFAHKECMITIPGYQVLKEILTTKSNTVTKPGTLVVLVLSSLSVHTSFIGNRSEMPSTAVSET